MPPHRSLILALTLAFVAIPLAGCMGDTPVEEAGSTEDEVSFAGNATPSVPFNAAIPVTEDDSSISMDVAITNVAGERGGEAVPVVATVILLAGYEEVFNRTYELTPSGSNGTEAPKGAEIFESFDRDVVELALQEEEQNRAIVLSIHVDRGELAVAGWLRANEVF